MSSRGGDRFRALVETIADGVVVVDSAGVARFVNPAAERILGRPAAGIVGQHFGFPVVAGESTEVSILHPDLGIRVAEIRTTETVWESEPAVLASIRDLTDLHAAQQEILEKEEQLRQAQKLEAVGRLAGGIAHDFNNLLGIIVMLTDECLVETEPNDPKHHDLTEIKEAAEQASVLTKRLLSLGRQQTLRVEKLDVNVAIRKVERLVRGALGEDVELRLDLAEDLGLVEADGSQLQRILLNLALNAKEAMPRGGFLSIDTANVELDADYAARHTGVKAGPYVRVAVTDSGQGMDSETQSRIFEPFFSTKDSTIATGLGLATVYGIVKQSGGNIWCYSEPGRGTTMKVYLPSIDAPPAISTRQPEPAAEAPSSSPATILVVEDEARLRKLVVRILKALGPRVLEAANGREALETAKGLNGEIDLVISDVVMKQMSGPELIERLRALDYDCRLLLMSGYPDRVVARHGQLPADAEYLEKPFSASALLEKVRSLLAAKPHRSKSERS